MAAFTTEPNRRIGSIEHVGKDGFIVTAVDINDPNFYGGKRLFPNFDELLRFLAEHLEVYRGQGATYGMKPKGFTVKEIEAEQELNGGNGAAQPSQIGREM